MVTGSAAETMIDASYSSPPFVTTPVTRPSLLRMARTGLSTRTSPPQPRTLADSASVIAPMPPTGRPVEPRKGISRGSPALPLFSEASDNGRIIRLNGEPGVEGATWPPTTASGATSAWVSGASSNSSIRSRMLPNRMRLNASWSSSRSRLRTRCCSDGGGSKIEMPSRSAKPCR